ncbi:MAG: DUF4249 family protein [Bacteroidales bacterium]|nr:DUF4249 family protein [Bacteroidales bacterium]MDY0143859.1 DUF4249 family protein [Bacteroidales bacterium]
MRYTIYYIIFLCLLCSSCRELVQDEFPDFENTVTVNTLIGAGDTVKVYLAYTDELNGNPLEIIENAVISMSNQNLESIIFTHQGKGLYVSNFVAQVSDTFNLSVIVPGEDVVTSSCVVPEPIEIIDADLDPYGCVNDEGVAIPLAYVKIRNNFDNAFYGVVYFKSYVKEPRISEDLNNPGSYTVDTVYVLNSDYKAIGTIDNINELGEFLEKEIEVFKLFDSNRIISVAFQVKLRTVDYNYYSYINSIGAYEASRYPNFSSSYIVPSNLFSNIENGYGIMGAFSEFETDTIFK